MFFPVSAYGSYHKFGFEIQAWNLTKKKANTTAVAYSKNSTQGHFFSSQVLSAGGLSESSGINAHCVFTLLSCETWYAKRKKKITCFSSSQMVSSDTLLLNFFTWFMLLLRTFLKASLDLLVDCLASLARLSLCSLVTLSTKKGREKCHM